MNTICEHCLKIWVGDHWQQLSQDEIRAILTLSESKKFRIDVNLTVCPKCNAKEQFGIEILTANHKTHIKSKKDVKSCLQERNLGNGINS
jgi:uncharacterized protein with PIN domain